jgi:hypothetical protein
MGRCSAEIFIRNIEASAMGNWKIKITTATTIATTFARPKVSIIDL